MGVAYGVYPMSRLAKRYRQAAIVKKIRDLYDNGQRDSSIFDVAKELPVFRKTKKQATNPSTPQQRFYYTLTSLMKWFEENEVGQSQLKSDLMKPVYDIVADDDFVDFCQPETTSPKSKEAQAELDNAEAELRAVLGL